MTLKKCILCSTATFLLGLAIGCWWSNHFSFHTASRRLFRCNTLTGEAWYTAPQESGYHSSASDVAWQRIPENEEN